MNTATNKATETTMPQWKALAAAFDLAVGWQARQGKPVMGADEATEIGTRIRAGKANADDLLVLGAMAPLMWQSPTQAGGVTLRARAWESLGIVPDHSDAAKASAIGNVNAILDGNY